MSKKRKYLHVSKLTIAQNHLDRAVFTLMIVVILFLGLFMSSTNVAYAAATRPLYSCINPHCYGQVEWDGAVDGAATTASV